MTNLLTSAENLEFVFGNTDFGLVWDTSHPAFYIFGIPIYLYAIVIVTGMALAILVGARYFKKRGYDPYDITIYALAVIPLGVLGARAYVYIFPWAGTVSDWSTYFEFRNGGLGIYGGVIVGYLAAFVVCKIKKQDFRIITDSILPGVLLAQSLGRWGNFFNQEAYGNLITSVYEDMPNWFEALNGGSRHGFNGIAVWIENKGWYQATFFYESVCTFIGFLICVLVLTRSKRYKLGWCTCFYGIYYGIVRLVIEGMRSDSLYLYIGTHATDIKISQLVSVFTIAFGLIRLSQIYRRQLHALYRKMFSTELRELSISRWILLGISVVCFGVAVAMFCLGGESRFIVGFVCTAVAVYSGLGIWSLCDRMKLYCPICGTNSVPKELWQSDFDKYRVAAIVYGVAMCTLTVFGVFSLVVWGIIDGISNGVVLFVVCAICVAAVGVWLFRPALRQMSDAEVGHAEVSVSCPDCGKDEQIRKVKLNPFLLFVFPPKVYPDYGVENLKPWVDPEKTKKSDPNGASE